MSVGLSLVAALLQEKDPHLLVEQEFNTDDFIGNEQIAYNFIINHLHQYGVLPETETVRVSTGIELPEIPHEPIKFWVDLFKQRAMATKLSKVVEALSSSMADGDYIKTAEVLRESSLLISRENTQGRINTLKEMIHTIMAEHDRRQRGQVELNTPFGFPYLDKISDGLQKGDTIALAGKTGAGKSYVLCHFANSAHAAGKVPLIVSMEMSAEQMGRRILALRSGIPEMRIARGNLSTTMTRPVVVESMLQIDGEQPFYIVDGKFSLKIDEIMSICQTLKPDVMFIDGAYLINMPSISKASSRWDKIADVAEQLKIAAGRLNIPILGTYQANADKSIYGSKAIQHLASIILFIADYKAEDEGERESWEVVGQEKTLEILKGRGGEQGKIKIVYDLVYGARIYQDGVLANYLVGEDGDE